MSRLGGQSIELFLIKVVFHNAGLLLFGARHCTLFVLRLFSKKLSGNYDAFKIGYMHKMHVSITICAKRIR